MKIALLRLSLALVCLSLILVCNFFAATLPPAILESAMRAELVSDGVIITTPVRNPGGTTGATLTLELVNSADEKIAEASQRITLSPGDNSVATSIRWDEFAATDATDRLDLVLWKRVRYHLKTDETKYAEARDITGVRSLGEILKEIFTLRVVAPKYSPQGTPAHVLVFAEHPFTRQPAPGVHIETGLYEDEKNRGEIRQAVTRGDGSAIFDLLPPISINHEREADFKLKITATQGFLSVENEDDITFRRESAAIVTTDKPLYQPGQTLHIRALVYDPYSHRPLKNEGVTLHVKDEDYKTAFERKLTTDRFGVTSADWAIPATAPLGTYSIRIEDDNERAIGRVNVRVSRYELPTFVVNIDPDKTFYLPGEDAKVKITAAFVYGGQVKAGHIRVAREQEREWNYQEQKWDIKEGSVWEGDADKDGAFTAKISLKEEQEEFEHSDYAKFKDVQYVARYTESASGRSEERRFKLRLTKEPIHVYVFSTDSRQSPELPLRLFIVANYADGTPAAVDLSVTGRPNEEENSPPVFALKSRTDRHGIALIEHAGDLKGLKEVRLSVKAQDSKGARGAYSESLPISSDEALRLKTARALYHQGEPLQVEIQSSVPQIPRLIVELFSDGRLIRSQSQSVREGHANCAFLPGSDLQGRVTIHAYDADEDTDYYWNRDRSATRNVLFPKRRLLAVRAKFERDTVKPGESARASFAALAPDGHGRETSLGVVVYDTAVEERERTESESGQGRDYFGSYYGAFCGWGDSLADVSLEELEQLDDARPFPADLELAADAILQRTGYNDEYLFLASPINGSNIRVTYRELLDPLKSTIDFVLNKQTASSYPRSRESLNRLLSLHGIEFDRVRDLWGNPYHVKFDVVDKDFTVEITSDGPDEQPGTSDDFTLTEHSHTFWEPGYEREILSAIDSFKVRKGHYPNNRDEVMSELRFAHASFLSAKDAWGNPYELRYTPSQNRPVYEVRVLSAGPDGKFNSKGNTDDLIMMTVERNWFVDVREKIRTVLAAHFAAKNEFPENETEFAAVLKGGGIDYSSLRDVWGQPLSLWFTESARYNWRTRIERVAATPNAPAVDKAIYEPLTQYIRTAWLGVSVQPNLAKEFTGVNEPIIFPLASYEQVIREETKEDALKELNVPATPKPSEALRKRVIPAGLAGAIAGSVTDPSGAVVSSATVTLTNSSTNVVLTTHTDDVGYFVFMNLNAGKYSVKVDAPGFKPYIIQEIDVRLSTTTAVDIILEVGTTSETVEVRAVAELVQTENASLSSVTHKQTVTIQQRANVASTPRLRQDFPETLVWQPSLVTDAQGKAELKFNVADSITTWRMAVIASTADGLIGSTTADLRAFQPFFVEHQPPPSLTVGDEIETPVVVRNFQDRAADVRVKLAPSPWMQIFGATEQTVHAEANSAATTPIRFKVTAAGEFKQEASAIGANDGDRVAKPVSVRFDGRDTFATYADLFRQQSTINFDVPDSAIQNSARAELKIYPDLFAHAVEGIEGIVQRPHGCAEQTTSSGYPNLIVLQYLKRVKRELPALEKRATDNLNETIARLRSFVTPNGGFGYFDGSNADVALTAYILRFLSEASEFAPVDEEIVAAARKFLVHEQSADGSWLASRYAGSSEETARLTALAVRSLVMSGKGSAHSSSQTNSADEVSKAVSKALDFLSQATRRRDDAYALALYILAAQETGRTGVAREAAHELIKLARPISGAMYWDIQRCTPFYGWGRTGNVETTGLAAEALELVGDVNVQSTGEPVTSGKLARHKDSVSPAPPGDLSQKPSILSQGITVNEDEEFARVARKGLLFLIQNKDEYGVWYSTQATINALHAIITVASNEDVASREPLKIAVGLDSGTPQIIELPVNDGSPVGLDLNKIFPPAFSTPGKHRVNLISNSGRTLSATLLARSTVPWGEQDTRGVSADGSLRVRVGYDRTEARVGEPVTCRVHAERVAAENYGMLLLEVGLPPGVDVDTESLRHNAPGKFDVTPDRVIFYLWSWAGGTDFNFNFRSRLKINAKAQPSVLYDYYNPEARVSLAPARFVMK